MRAHLYTLLPLTRRPRTRCATATQVESMVITKGGTEVDIGCGNSFGGGAADEAVDDNVEKVNNVIDSFNFSETPFSSKTEFKEYLKEYVRKVRTLLKDAGKPQPEVRERESTRLRGVNQVYDQRYVL
jgi:Translationally controlled tumour protein